MSNLQGTEYTTGGAIGHGGSNSYVTHSSTTHPGGGGGGGGIGESEVILSVRDAARQFLGTVFEGEYTQDAEDQLVEVFVPCLRIMCGRPWDPNGRTWRESGIFGVLGDTRKKFTRFWYRTWTMGIRHDDSGSDLINYVGFVMRSDPKSRFGDWGEPAPPEPPASERMLWAVMLRVAILVSWGVIAGIIWAVIILGVVAPLL